MPVPADWRQTHPIPLGAEVEIKEGESINLTFDDGFQMTVQSYDVDCSFPVEQIGHSGKRPWIGTIWAGDDATTFDLENLVIIDG